MYINDVMDIADRIDQLIADATGFGKPMRLLIDELSDFADELRDMADQMDAKLEEQANEFEYNRQFDYA